MELLYKPQDLLAGQLNHGYNEIVNTEIIRPSWKQRKTYGDTFFIKKRDGISESIPNTPDGDIVDSIIIDEIEYLLIFNGFDIEVAYYDGLNYTGLGLGLTRGDDTPYKFAIGNSGRGEIFDGVTIADAYRDTHYAGTWLIGNIYVTDDIVIYNGTEYIALVTNDGKQPDTNEDEWAEYVTDDSGYIVEDPSTIVYRDVFKSGYLKLKLKKTNIRDIALTGSYLLFNTGDSGLEGVSTKIQYIGTDYVDITGATIALPNDEIYVYIRSTNSVGIRPYIGEGLLITTEVGKIPVIATEDKIISLHIKEELGVITGAETVDLYTASDGDYIIDLVKYNGVLFILTRDKIIYSSLLEPSNINIYGLDNFQNLNGLNKLVPFGKTMVIFGTTNGVIIPVMGTEGTEGYIYNDFHYNGDLYSKYSVLATMGSLYVLQDDKQFLQVSVVSENNIDYKAELTNIIPSVRGQFDFITGDIFMNEWDRQIYVLDKTSNETYYYKYDIEYKHWDIGDYLTPFYKIEDKLYGGGLYEFNSNYFDNTSDYRQQVVGFDFGGEDLHTLKEVVIVKMIFGLNEKILDYELEVQYQLGGILHTKIIDLKNYPINLEIAGQGGGLGDSGFNETLIGNGLVTETEAIGNFVSVTVGLGITASVFNFKIKSKENGFIYGGSIVGYVNKMPTVTEYNYKH